MEYTSRIIEFVPPYYYAVIDYGRIVKEVSESTAKFLTRETKPDRDSKGFVYWKF